MTTRPLQPLDKEDAAKIAAGVAALAEMINELVPDDRDGAKAQIIADQMGALSQRLWPQS